MNKEKPKKKKSKLSLFILVTISLLILFLIIIMSCAYIFKIPTKSIIIQGNNIIKDDEILEISNLKEHPNFILTSTKDIEKSLKNNHFIKEVSVKKSIFFEIDIKIKEYKTLFIREDTNKIVTSDYKEIDNSEEYNLNIPYLINYVPDTKYKELIEKTDKVDYKLLQKISQIIYSPTKYDEDRFILYMNDSNRVYINLPKFKNFNKYDEMVTKFEGKTGKLYLDSGNYFEIDK